MTEHTFIWIAFQARLQGRRSFRRSGVMTWAASLGPTTRRSQVQILPHYQCRRPKCRLDLRFGRRSFPRPAADSPLLSVCTCFSDPTGFAKTTPDKEFVPSHNASHWAQSSDSRQTGGKRGLSHGPPEP